MINGETTEEQLKQFAAGAGSERVSRKKIKSVINEVDIILNFHTTYVNRKGEVVSNHASIVLNYIKGWCIVDVLAGFPFELLYAIDIYKGDHGQFHLLKLTRLLRLARLLQKIDRYSQYSAIILTLLMLFFTIVAHWLACIWYVIAKKESHIHWNDTEWNQGWLHSLADRFNYENITYLTNSELYITALYFTCSSLTSVGFGNVSANTSYEKVFSIILMLIGALMHAVVFGNVTAIIQRMYSRRSQYQYKWRDLKEFFTLYRIPKELKQRMQDYFQTMWSLNHGIDIHHTLKEFPEELRGDVCMHLHKEVLQLPIFMSAGQGCLKLLSLHIRSNFCAPGEYLARKGDALTSIYYLCNGSMEVVQNEMVVAILGKGDLVGSDINPYLTSSGGISTAVTAGGNEIVVKSSADIKALTYCDLKCINIHGLVDVLRLYPEYQQEFANDIQHDLTYNLREGYEAEESITNGGPSMTLPSISEDDENIVEDGETSPLSPPNRSPLHAAVSPARHNKYKKAVLLRAASENNPDKLDSQKIDTLHHHMETLSQEVRNAIQALQELATTTTTCVAAHHPYPVLPAHSNPNLPIGAPRLTHSALIPRSSSHPPEVFRELEGLVSDYQHPMVEPGINPCWYRNASTQTEPDMINLFRIFVRHNPRIILNWLEPYLRRKYFIQLNSTNNTNSSINSQQSLLTSSQRHSSGNISQQEKLLTFSTASSQSLNFQPLS